MPALKTQSPDPADQATKFLTKHRERFDRATEAARAAAETTATAAWQAMYQSRMKAHRDFCTACVTSLNAAINAIQMGAADDPDTEKLIRGVAKDLKGERIAHDAWVARTVRDYEGTVDYCETMRRQATIDAQVAEESAPLHSRGLADAVRREVDKWPMPSWDEQTGVVSV